MTTTEDRIRALVHEHLDLGREPDFESEDLSDSGVSSVDAVAFIKKVGQAFNVEMPPEEFANFKTLRDVATFIDNHAG